MPIKYTIVENSLKEGTYFPKIIQDLVLDINELSHNITSKTTLNEGTVRAVISALREEIIRNLIQGNGIKIDDLMTISMSLRGVLENPNIPINHKNTELYVNTRISRSLNDEVRNLAHFTRVVKPPKSPIMTLLQSLPQHLIGYYMPNAPSRISGNNLKFHPNKKDEGIICIQSDNTHHHIPFYSVVGNKQTDFTITDNLGDIRIQLNTRYGNSQEIRSGKYEHIVKVMIATAFENTVIVRNYTGSSGTAILTADKNTGSLSYQADGDTAGTATPITKADTYTLISGSVDNSIVVDIIDYEAYLSVITEIETPTAEITWV